MLGASSSRTQLVGGFRSFQTQSERVQPLTCRKLLDPLQQPVFGDLAASWRFGQQQTREEGEEFPASRDPCRVIQLHAAHNLCNGTRMAEWYAPPKNVGGAFITQALREKMSWILTMSNEIKPALMRALRRSACSNSDSTTSDAGPTVPTSLSGTSEIPSDNTDSVSDS